MDLGQLAIFLFWIYILYSLIGKRKKKAPPKEEMPQEREEPAHPAKEARKSGYDYEGFRKKLRQSWGNAPEQEEKKKPIFHAPQKTNEARQDVPLPKSRSPMPVPEEPVMTAAEKRRFEAMQALAAQDTKKEKAKEAESTPKRTEKTASPEEMWTEEAVEKWAVYDAVLGSPRSRKPWQPRR